MVLQKQFHGFSVHNEFVFDSHFSAIAMEFAWISASLGGLVASKDHRRFSEFCWTSVALWNHDRHCMVNWLPTDNG